MSDTEITIAIGIHFVIPLIGLLYYLWIISQMRKNRVPQAPAIELFIIFSTYGGLLLTILTTLFWKWSLMASLGSVYLILVAPIIMAIIVFKHNKTRSISTYHNGVYVSGLLYFIVVPVTFLLLFLMK